MRFHDAIVVHADILVLNGKIVSGRGKSGKAASSQDRAAKTPYIRQMAGEG
ncbi:hypothetical protein [Acidiferrobacter sp. SPIII_3]|uniref:hypothetical protein n=1 Tax=Acidiferrobacter sp. SPIII_3 TaxID=1281578 RepID=UPI00143DF7C9|nr:hypothetical protein [Acidiferrobacter sp. SPIII_3]